MVMKLETYLKYLMKMIYLLLLSCSLFVDTPQNLVAFLSYSKRMSKLEEAVYYKSTALILSYYT